jgi:hypothetical protein
MQCERGDGGTAPGRGRWGWRVRGSFTAAILLLLFPSTAMPPPSPPLTLLTRLLGLLLVAAAVTSVIRRAAAMHSLRGHASAVTSASLTIVIAVTVAVAVTFAVTFAVAGALLGSDNVRSPAGVITLTIHCVATRRTATAATFAAIRPSPVALAGPRRD